MCEHIQANTCEAHICVCLRVPLNGRLELASLSQGPPERGGGGGAGKG